LTVGVTGGEAGVAEVAFGSTAWFSGRRGCGCDAFPSATGHAVGTARRAGCWFTIRSMPAVVRVGVRAMLDENRTDEQFLGAFVALFAELDDGGVVETDPSHYRTHGPRRGLGAVWGRYDGVNVAELPGFDPELFERDPDEAFFQALESSYRLQPKDIEDSVREHLFPAEFLVGRSENARNVEVEDSDATWGSLASALRAHDIDATAASLRSAPFRMEFDAALLAELDR
jgi:hypothetical protein